MERFRLTRIIIRFFILSALFAFSESHSIEPIQPLVYPIGLNLEKVELGKLLFQDVRLSKNQNISCLTCHAMDKGGADGLPQSVGTHGETTSRNTPTIFNSVFNIVQFWDGRANNLAEQIDAVVKNPVEMDANWDLIVSRLEKDKPLEKAMKAHYKPAITKESISDALSEYMEALVTIDSPFDRYLLGDENAIGPDAKEGYERFKTMGCIACHQGINVGGNLFQKAGLMTAAAEYEGITNIFRSDMGRYEITGRERDKYVFRVPSLRNIALTAPYFHAGQVTELREAIQIMGIYQLGKPLPEADVELIHSFLETLTGIPPEKFL